MANVDDAPLLSAEEQGKADQKPKRVEHDEKFNKLLDAAAQRAPGQLAQCLKSPAVVAVLDVLIKIAMWVIPKYVALYTFVFTKIYPNLPTEVATMVFGIALCFFGGEYYASIAAVEAFRLMGWQRTYENLCIVYEEYETVRKESEKDDEKDDDHDGIADVDQIEVVELFHRKTTLAMVSIKDPERFQLAIGGLWSSWLAVLASLRMEFARTTAIALGLAECAREMSQKAFAPILASLMSKEKHHWIKSIIDTTITFIAMIFSWYLQAIISAFYSGIRGGLMFARTGLRYAAVKFPGAMPQVWADIDFEDTIVDEMIGYSLAASGFIFQLYSNYTLPFPINIILLPLTIVEYWIRWQVASSSGITV